MRFSLSLANAPRQLLPQVKASLRKKVPLLTASEIRRVKSPLVEALAEELKEEECHKALEIYARIIKSDKGRIFKRNKGESALPEIFETLKLIEKQSREEEIESLMQLVWSLWDYDEEFDWLIECVLIIATEKITDYHLEGTRTDAVARLTHGKSLFRRLRWHRAALLHLEYAFHIALPHDEWTFGERKLADFVAFELSSCAVEFSKTLRKQKEQLESAAIYAKRALTVLRIGQQKVESLPHECDAETELASCCLDAGDYESALSHFEHAAAIAERCNMKESFYNSLIEIAKCHEILENHEKQEIYLKLAMEIAEENSLELLTGDVAFELMKLHVNEYNHENAEKYFIMAVENFEKLERSKKLDEIHEIYAEFKTKSKFNKIVDAVLKIDKGERGNNRDLVKMIDWLDHNSPEIFDDNDTKEDLDLEAFIKKYYDPDEIVKVE